MRILILILGVVFSIVACQSNESPEKQPEKVLDPITENTHPILEVPDFLRFQQIQGGIGYIQCVGTDKEGNTSYYPEEYVACDCYIVMNLKSRDQKDSIESEHLTSSFLQLDSSSWQRTRYGFNGETISIDSLSFSGEFESDLDTITRLTKNRDGQETIVLRYSTFQ